MTEVPDYLLERSRERRRALGLLGEGEGGEAAAPAPAESGETPAAAATPTTPEPAATPVAPEPAAPPKPPPPHVQAALRRKRIPVWALPVLVALPLWAYIYASTIDLGGQEAEASDPLTVGEQVYAENCASCHGGGGEGGSGPLLTDGAVLETFSDPATQVQWVALGSDGWRQENGGTYGDSAKPVEGGMPAWEGTLTEAEIAAVVLHERITLSGGDAADHEDLMAEAGGSEGGGHG